jgi:hypothetical protein
MREVGHNQHPRKGITGDGSESPVVRAQSRPAAGPTESPVAGSSHEPILSTASRRVTRSAIMEDNERADTTGQRLHRRTGNWLAVSSLFIALIIVLFGDTLIPRIRSSLTAVPSTMDRVLVAFEECRQPTLHCEITKTLHIANGAGELTAVGVNLIGGELRADSGSAVVVFDASGNVRWKSPIQNFSPGYGLLALETDVSNHVFAKFAITNHSQVVWVVDPSSAPAQTFGTVGSGGLPIDDVGSVDGFGLRPLFTYREGSPANCQNPTTSRDVFQWDGSDYAYRGCEVVRFVAGTRVAEVLEFIPKGTRPCEHPMGKPSVNLDGRRPGTTPPP